MVCADGLTGWGVQMTFAPFGQRHESASGFVRPAYGALRHKLFCFLVLFSLGVGVARADENCVNMRLEFDQESRIITFLFEKICESEISIDNSFGFTYAELANPIASRIESLASPEYAYPYGVCVKFASLEGKLLSEGWCVQNRVLISSFLTRKRMVLERGREYVKRLRLSSLVGGMERYLGFDPNKSCNLAIQIRFELFLEEPVVKVIAKETPWIRLACQWSEDGGQKTSDSRALGNEE
jgi:hypothetical protein